MQYRKDLLLKAAEDSAEDAAHYDMRMWVRLGGKFVSNPKMLKITPTNLCGITMCLAGRVVFNHDQARFCELLNTQIKVMGLEENYDRRFQNIHDFGDEPIVDLAIKILEADRMATSQLTTLFSEYSFLDHKNIVDVVNEFNKGGIAAVEHYSDLN
jgi:hypothetical protein